MIFVTVGTHHQPFERMLDGLAPLDGGELVVQYGTGAPPPGVSRAEAFMPFDEMLSHFREADAVLTHAGVGSILCATREGHVPLVVPRRHELGEHVDDHQSELTRALADRGSVVAIWEMGELADALAAVPERRQVQVESRAALGAAVGAALRGV